MAAQALRAAWPGLRVELTPMATSGDRAKTRLADIGGKGLFTKELEEALLRGEADIAVHSAKDVPALLPPGLMLAAALPREDARDALVSHKAACIEELPRGAILGTSSPRRGAQLLRLRPDLNIVEFRGNVPTRLSRLQEGAADAAILAMAGLKRLGLFEARRMHPLSPDTMLPAAGQGAVCIECREDDAAVRDMLSRVNDRDCWAALTAERAVLEIIEGTCFTPVAVHAALENGLLALKAALFSPDGADIVAAEETGAPEDAAGIGRRAGEGILARDKEGLRHG